MRMLVVREMILGLVFSKDRAMQLDATLSSFFRQAVDADSAQMVVLFRTSSDRHAAQYAELEREYRGRVRFVPETQFRRQLLQLLNDASPAGPVLAGILSRLRGRRLRRSVDGRRTMCSFSWMTPCLCVPSGSPWLHKHWMPTWTRWVFHFGWGATRRTATFWEEHRLFRHLSRWRTECSSSRGPRLTAISHIHWSCQVRCIARLNSRVLSDAYGSATRILSRARCPCRRDGSHGALPACSVGTNRWHSAHPSIVCKRSFRTGGQDRRHFRRRTCRTCLSVVNALMWRALDGFVPSACHQEAHLQFEERSP